MAKKKAEPKLPTPPVNPEDSGNTLPPEDEQGNHSEEKEEKVAPISWGQPNPGGMTVMM